MSGNFLGREWGRGGGWGGCAVHAEGIEQLVPQPGGLGKNGRRLSRVGVVGALQRGVGVRKGKGCLMCLAGEL